MQENKQVVEIDCLGDVCPIPIMKIQQNLSRIKEGTAHMLVTDHSCTLTSVAGFCKNHKLNYNSTEVQNGVWEIIISR